MKEFFYKRDMNNHFLWSQKLIFEYMYILVMSFVSDAIRFTIISNKKTRVEINVQISDQFNRELILYGFRHRNDVAYPLKFSQISGDYTSEKADVYNRLEVRNSRFSCVVSTRDTLKTGWSSFDTISLTLTNATGTIHLISPILTCPVPYRVSKSPAQSPSKSPAKVHISGVSGVSGISQNMRTDQNHIPISTLDLNPIPANPFGQHSILSNTTLISMTPVLGSSTTLLTEIKKRKETPVEVRWPMWLDAPIIYDREKKLKRYLPEDTDEDIERLDQLGEMPSVPDMPDFLSVPQ